MSGLLILKFELKIVFIVQPVWLLPGRLHNENNSVFCLKDKKIHRSQTNAV